MTSSYRPGASPRDPRDVLHRDVDPGDAWEGWYWDADDDDDEPFGREPMHYVPPGGDR